ncbi:hypothetical protein FRC06_007578 [Ceratobasidium sp. 370]|nr:hypothetical protein FRC06_007578 [Ceratobasidium sp. 370]
MKLGRPAYVYECFNIVAGTGMGAIIACMLGRLRMPIEVAIDLYQRISEVFSGSKHIGTTAFSTIKLIAALKDIVRQATGDEDTRMVDTQPDAEECRTYD